MKILIILVATLLMAQTPYPWPETRKLYNNNTGQVVGSVTQWGSKFVMRNLKGNIIGTLVLGNDGSRTFFDPNGHQVDTLSVE